MIAPFKITFIAKFKCHLCEETHEVENTFFAGQQIPLPSMPPGWKGPIQSAIFCPKHKIKLSMDGGAPVLL